MHITKRLSVEGPDGSGGYEMRITGCECRRYIFWLTRAEADALIAALQPKDSYVDWGAGELLAMAALDMYPIEDGLPKSTSVVYRIHQLGRAYLAIKE